MFPAELARQIDQCAAFVLVLTPNACASPWVARELLRAVHRGKPVLPVLLAACDDPPILTEGLHREDVTAGGMPSEGFINRLLSLAEASTTGHDLGSSSPPRVASIARRVTASQIGGPILGHGGPVTTLAYSPDGCLLASGGDDGTVRLRDAATGQQIGRSLMGHARGVRSIAFSPDGTALACSSVSGVRLWDPQSGEQLCEPSEGPTGDLYSVAFDPDGRKLTTGCADGTVGRWELWEEDSASR